MSISLTRLELYACFARKSVNPKIILNMQNKFVSEGEHWWSTFYDITRKNSMDIPKLFKNINPRKYKNEKAKNAIPLAIWQN